MSVDLSDPMSRRESLISISSCSTDPLPRNPIPAHSLVTRTSCCALQALSRSTRIKCAAGVIGIAGLTGFVLSNVYDSSDSPTAKVFQLLTCSVALFSIAVIGMTSGQVEELTICNR